MYVRAYAHTHTNIQSANILGGLFVETTGVSKINHFEFRVLFFFKVDLGRLFVGTGGYQNAHLLYSKHYKEAGSCHSSN